MWAKTFIFYLPFTQVILALWSPINTLPFEDISLGLSLSLYTAVILSGNTRHLKNNNGPEFSVVRRPMKQNLGLVILWS
jgi:hypothetical protein